MGRMSGSLFCALATSAMESFLIFFLSLLRAQRFVADLEKADLPDVVVESQPRMQVTFEFICACNMLQVRNIDSERDF